MGPSYSHQLGRRVIKWSDNLVTILWRATGTVVKDSGMWVWGRKSGWITREKVQNHYTTDGATVVELPPAVFVRFCNGTVVIMSKCHLVLMQQCNGIPRNDLEPVYVGGLPWEILINTGESEMDDTGNYTAWTPKPGTAVGFWACWSMAVSPKCGPCPMGSTKD